MFLKIFLGINIIASVALTIYEKKASPVRRHFLEGLSLKRFTDVVNTSITGVIGLLSFSSVVFSIWAGFGFAAPSEMKSLYGEDIFMILATCSLALFFYAVTMYAYHLSQFLKLKKEDSRTELKFRKNLFMRGETFFIFGTTFFLLTFIYSLITMASVLAPSFDCLVATILFLTFAIAILACTTAKELWQILTRFEKISSTERHT